MQLLQAKKSSARKSRFKLKLFLGLLVVGGIVAFFAYQPALLSYKQWKQARALRQAREFLDQHDAADAKLALDVAIYTLPGSVEVWRTAADMLEEVGAPQAMRLRRHVVELAPDDAEAQAALVMCAMKFRDYNAARDALSLMSPEVANKPPTLRAALAYALATDNRPIADALFDRLNKLDSGDPNLAVAHASLRLKHPSAEVAGAARTELEKLALTSKHSLQIYRTLATDAIARKAYDEAKNWFGKVVASPDSGFDDRLQIANIELLVDHKPFDSIFANLAPLAAEKPTDAAHFVSWLLVQRKTAQADKWLQSLKPELLQTPVLISIQADVAAQSKNWDRLVPLLEKGAWGPIDHQTLQLADAARVVSEKGGPEIRAQIWEIVLRSAGRSLGPLSVLNRFAAVLGWDAESESTLWTIARSFPDQTWAHQNLFNLYHENKNLNGMRQVMDVLRQSNPGVARYRHDWALLTLLAEPTSGWNQPKEIAKQVHEENPDDPSYTTTYAFALAQAGRATEALKVIETLSPAVREFPPRLPYVAYIYGVNHKRDEVDRLDRLADHPHLMPEELQLFNRAREAADYIKVAPVKPVMPARPASKDEKSPNP